MNASRTLKCGKCGIGELVPEIREYEPESAEQYRCDECGNLTVIQSLSIILSQLFSGIFGLLITPYLVLLELIKLAETTPVIAKEHTVSILLCAFGIVLSIGFLYLMYHSLRDMMTRIRFRNFTKNNGERA